MTLLIAALAVSVFFTSWWLTGRVRQYAIARRLLDVPNARSSHVIATPRGGGIAIVVTTLAALIAAWFAGWLPWMQMAGLVGGGAMVAAIGFVEDLEGLARRWRLLGHFVAAAWVLAWFGGPPPLNVLERSVDLGWVGYVLGAVYLVWVLNLTNFMDGIDGMAAIEVITVTVGSILLYQFTIPGERGWVAALLLASANAGFLVWNWPPAKIFMGDAGSGFAGLLLAAFSLQAAWDRASLLWSWAILLGVFIVDATVTLMRRAIRGQRVYEAHRAHAYQHAALRFGSHKRVTCAVATVNLAWLLPLALLVARGSLDGLIGLAIAYAPLVGAAFLLGAGVSHPSAKAGAGHV